jgi:hypothetical protein
MHTSRLLSFFALLTAYVANASLLDSNTDYALILSRQAPGTPQYECHSNCGKSVLLLFCSPPSRNGIWNPLTFLHVINNHNAE